VGPTGFIPPGGVLRQRRNAGEITAWSARFEDDLNSRKLSAGVEFDARTAWRIRPRTEIYMAAENLLDEELEVGETADGVESYAAPRMLRIGLSFRRCRGLVDIHGSAWSMRTDTRG
jgi:outer membrane receptor protein involved in Fe transport